MAQLWGGRFTKETDKLVYNFNASISFDQKILQTGYPWKQGTWLPCLQKQGILTEEEKEQITEGLDGILADVESRQAWRSQRSMRISQLRGGKPDRPCGRCR